MYTNIGYTVARCALIAFNSVFHNVLIRHIWAIIAVMQALLNHHIKLLPLSLTQDFHWGEGGGRTHQHSGKTPSSLVGSGSMPLLILYLRLLFQI